MGQAGHTGAESGSDLGAAASSTAGDSVGARPVAAELDVLARLRQRLLGVGATEPDAATAAHGEPAIGAPLRCGETIGAYRLLHPLGHGGMGEVWLAADPRLGRNVAIKVLQPHAARDASRIRLVREAQAIAQIGHPNVVAIYDTGTIDGDDSPAPRAFIAMEYIEGRSLAEWLGAAERSQAEILAAFVAAGHGLAAAHRAGQIHRDFKPANVMIGDRGEVKVLDFGIAVTDGQWRSGPEGDTDVSPRVRAGSGDSGRLTETGVVMGTPRYMSPEQHTGATVTAASDQFSFCCALLEALQGGPVFVGRGAVELGRAKLRGNIADGPTPVPTRLSAVITRGLARRPEDRWPSMPALLQQLTRRRGRRPLLTLAVALTGLGAATVAAASPEPCTPRPGLSDAQAERIREMVGGDTVANRVVSTLRDHDARLTDIEVETCNAHRDGQLDEVAFDRRIACLNERRRDLEQATAMLARGDTMRDRPLVVARSLAEGDDCADDDRLALAVAPPSDLVTARAVDRARMHVSTADTLLLGGLPRESLAAVDEARAAVAAIDYPPVTAEIGFAAGKAQVALRDHAAADTLEHALAVAESAGHERIAASIAAYLVHAAVRQPANLERLPAILRHADAAIVRAGDPATARGDYLSALATLYTKRGQFVLSLTTAEHARAIYATVLEPDDPRLDAASFNAAVAIINLKSFDQGAARMAEVVANRERSYGPNHPSTIMALAASGIALLNAGDLDEAEARLGDAIERIEASFGTTDGQLPLALGALGDVAARRGHLDVARAHYRRAVAISERRDGVHGPETATLAGSLGEIEGRLGHLDDARLHLAQSLAGHERMVGREHALVAEAYRRMAEVDLRADDPINARAHAREAIAILAPLGATAAELAVLQRPLDAAEQALAADAASSQSAAGR